MLEMSNITQVSGQSMPYFCNSSNHYISNLTVEPTIQKTMTFILQKQQYTNQTIYMHTLIHFREAHFTYLVLSGLTQISLSTLCTSPATEAVSLSSST